MTRNSRKPHQEGVALVTAVIFVAVALVVLSALSMRVVNQNNTVQQYTRYKEAFLGVEAGLATSIAAIDTASGDGMVGMGTWVATGPEPTPTMASMNIAPVQMAGSPNVTYIAHALEWNTDGIDNNGEGTIDGADEDWIYSVTAFATYPPITRGAETVIEGTDVNVWRNAIFGGTGQAGGLINGNVSIHGSVHLLGDDIAAGNAAVAAIDLSGTSLIHNNYDGLDAGLAARVPSLDTTLWNGEMVETLEAKVRVKNGLVGMDGNSEIGSPDAAGNSVKETMDGTYVNDGWTGNSVTDDGDRGDPQSVYSDNGWDESYDLGDRVPLPILTDDWKDPISGATTIDPVTLSNYTHADYFDQQLAGEAYAGDMLIEANVDFYYNATRPLDPDPANLQPTDDYILFDAASNVMEINGQIVVTGNLEITRGNGNDKTINYTGRAAILVQGDVTLNTDLLSRNADGSTNQSFPVNNILGIMAGNNMMVGALSQLELMGAFYAQNTASTQRQSTIMGTFVSNYFDMGTNVPSIYQVPQLADNLPMGMIGAYPILVYEVVSWREI
jgi:hypothetical protein